MPLTTKHFQVRDFQPTEFELLWKIDQDCFTPDIAYSRAELKTYMLRRAAFTLVAVSTAGEVVADSELPKFRKDSSADAPAAAAIMGFIVAEGGARAGHIITLDVIAAARRLGAGSLLLSTAEERLRLAGCRQAELETAVDNISALSFYKRHGYAVTKTFPRYYSNGLDALVLEKDLSAS